ncbi:LUD domain-containing protein [Nonomuraea sp. NPDC005650]|uniref:LUD domain-containing protein n=1 Tax=Nonomuraea sp. NPDC005650 TaxID=3157045 RepID=UPI0033A0A493
MDARRHRRRLRLDAGARRAAQDRQGARDQQGAGRQGQDHRRPGRGPHPVRHHVPLLPRDESVFTTSSETLRLSGIAADIDDSGEFASVRVQAGDLGDDAQTRIRLGATPDVVVGSAHAVTEDGHLVVASASGSRLAPYASGARKAIWVIGAQKVVPALRRIRSYSLPREHLRLQELGQSSFIGKILILEREALPERGTIVLVHEPIGF